MDGEAHRQHGGEDQANGQLADGALVAAKIAPGRVVGRCEQERRKEKQKHEVRVELHLRYLGHQRQYQPAEDEEDGVREAQPLGDGGQDHHRQEEPHHQLQRRFDVEFAHLGAERLTAAAAGRALFRRRPPQGG